MVEMKVFENHKAGDFNGLKIFVSEKLLDIQKFLDFPGFFSDAGICVFLGFYLSMYPRFSIPSAGSLTDPPVSPVPGSPFFSSPLIVSI